MRLIDADALMEDINESLSAMTGIGIAVGGDWLWAKLNDAIEHAPTIEPERKKGKWIEKDLDNFRKYEVVCSECGSRYIGNYDAYDEPCDFMYCPSCGAKMEEGEDNERA